MPNAYKDLNDNVHCTVGASRTLFSSHTDTVHRTDGANSYIRATETVVNPTNTYAPRTVYRGNNAPLGADCGAGVALMVHMIMNGIPGHYVFHAAEEVGGIGSKALAKSGIFNNLFDRAIAFDRKATHSVITHQSRGQCCSTLFAEALSKELNDANLDFMYAPDDTGVYTDTAEYIDQIPECTNVSVGYYDEHSADERLDYTFLSQLANAVLLVQWEALPIGIKDPVEPRAMGFLPSFNTQYGQSFNDVDYAEDLLYEMFDSYPDILADFTVSDIENISTVLGTEGALTLVDLVDTGMYSPQKIRDALNDPQGFLNELPENILTQEVL